jgi:hypothetical protein
MISEKKRMMVRRSAILLAVCGMGLFASASLAVREHAPKPAFKYIGGTMVLPDSCEGNLEMGSDAMTFECGERTVRIPYNAIRFMQYRPDISRKVRRLKPRWKVQPEIVTPMIGGKGNRFFTIVYREKAQDPVETLVLAVSPDAMRPYLAEIDLRAGQRVEVENLDDYY